MTSPISNVSSNECSNPQREFAIILSKAVSDSRDLREFIKTEACLQVNKDYEVFYPWVKNKTVSAGNTFREILLPYCETEAQLLRIEHSLPLLTILIPDLSWISEGFSNPETWDVFDNEVLVTYRDDNDNREFILDGQTAFCINDNEIVDGVFLVVKNNERITVNSQTKVGDSLDYCFVSDVFNNIEPETRAGSWVYTYEYPQVSDYSYFVSTEDLQQYSPLSIQAYNISNSNPEALQRDYCYYGMTPSGTSGKLNTRVKEGLYRFRFITVDRFQEECDDFNTAKSDPMFSNSITYKKTDGGIGKSLFGLMTDGSLEIYVGYCYGHINSGETVLSKSFGIKAKDVLQVSMVKKGFQHKTLVNKRHYSYQVTFVPKWYYPEEPVEFFNWDLFSLSTVLSLHFWEKDSNGTTSITDDKTITWDFSGNFDRERGDTKKNKFGLKLDYKSSRNYKVSWTYTEKDDDLGWATVGYSDNIIDGTASGGYTLYPYTTGNRIVFNLLPYGR